MSICYVNGSFENKSDAMISIQDRGFNFSDGVYEVMSFSDKFLINFNKHIIRLNRSLENLKIKKPIINTKSLRIILQKLIKLNNLNDGYLYLQITRGSSTRNHLFPKSVMPNMVIFTFTVKYDENLINKGVNIRLTDDIRWGRCDIKSISLLPNVLEKQRAFQNGFYESWQIKNKFITEGSTSNAFIINKDNTIQTHPINNLILGGVTRDSVIEIIKKNELSLKEKAFTVSDLNSCKEAFLTSTTVKILPVIKFDNSKIGDGKPGKTTKTLIQKYDDFIKSQING